MRGVCQVVRGGPLAVPLAVSLSVAACVTPGVPPRVAFSAAFSEGHERRAAGPKTVLVVALEAFAAAAPTTRRDVPPGAPMPLAHTQAWERVLDVVDAQTGHCTALDLVRTRLVLQGELDADKGAFGDLPAPLAERIVHALGAVSSRLTALTTRPRQANPATFLWPTRPVIVTSPWGERVHPLHGNLRFHAGTDLAGEPGQEVRAAAAGTVVFAGWNGAHGKQVELQHDAHLATRYSHLMTWLVDPGQQVRKGEVIALVGETGQVTGPHLHFELRRDGESVDPEQALPAPPEQKVSAR